MALRALILAALLALVSSGTTGNKEISTAILDQLIAGLRAEGKLQGRHEEAITALREEFPDLITSVRNENKSQSSHALYTKIAEFLKQEGEAPHSHPPVGGFSTGVPSQGGGDGGGGGMFPTSGGGGGMFPTSGGGGGMFPTSGGGGSYVPPSGGGGSYVQPSGGGGSYVPPSGGGGSYVPPSGGGGSYVPPTGGGGGYVLPSGGGGSYVPPSGGGGSYVPPSGGGGSYVPPKGGEGGYVTPSGSYGQQGGDYQQNMKTEIFNIMDTIMAIMKYQGLIYDTDNPVWTLIDRGFDLLADFVRRNIRRNKHDGECPYSYDEAGELCLSADLNALGLSWYEARLYCQVVKGGDLAIFKDANQIHDMQRYLRSFDKKYRYSYWIGASDVKKENFWEFINGEPVPLGTPYWGRTTYDGTQNPSGGEDSDYAILYGKDFFYLADVSYEEAYDIKVVPLCQFFHGRGQHDHAGYHSENGAYHMSTGNLATKLTQILATSSSGAYGGSYGNNHGYKKP